MIKTNIFVYVFGRLFIAACTKKSPRFSQNRGLLHWNANVYSDFLAKAILAHLGIHFKHIHTYLIKIKTVSGIFVASRKWLKTLSNYGSIFAGATKMVGGSPSPEGL